MKALRLALALLSVFLIAGCSGGDNGTSSTPPTVVPNIHVVSVDKCSPFYDPLDFAITVGCTFRNDGTGAGGATAVLWVEQPQGRIVDTYSQSITLQPGQAQYIEKTEYGPTLSGTTAYCNCGVR